MDIVGFTSMSKEVPPDAVMTFLNQLFTHFDLLCDSHGVQKVGGQQRSAETCIIQFVLNVAFTLIMTV